MDPFKALRARAALSVKKPDWEYSLRRIFRWYSTTFHTPLHQVEDLPIDHVLTNYYEAVFEALEPDKFEEEIQSLISPPVDTDAEKENEDEANVDLEDFIREAEEEARAARLQKEQQESKQPLPLDDEGFDEDFSFSFGDKFDDEDELA